MRSALMPVVSGSRARKLLLAVIVAVAAIAVAVQSAAAKPSHSFISHFHLIKAVASTVPANGDVNPYGVAVAPVTKGRLVKGDVLVSNFNNKKNLQGTGRSIVEVSPKGKTRLFASLHASKLHPCPGGIGLTTALVVLKSGWVVVGSLPTKDGTSATAKAGCLIVLNSSGKAVTTIHGRLINGPWDMTAFELDHGMADLFVTNVLNGTVAASPNTVNRGTVVRIDLRNLNRHMPKIHSETVIGRGFPERTDPAALVVGPTGLGLGRNDRLYVADSASNRIAAIGHALTRRTASHAGRTVSTGGNLNDPLGLTIAPNGDILTANGGNGNLVETTPAGNQIAVKVLDTTPAPPGLPGNGTLFGLAVAPAGTGVYFVNDGSNTLNLLH
jgi:hypothetical protein